MELSWKRRAVAWSGESETRAAFALALAVAVGFALDVELELSALLLLLVAAVGVGAVDVAVVVAVDALRRRFFRPNGHSGMATETQRLLLCGRWTAAYATLDDVYDGEVDEPKRRREHKG